MKATILISFLFLSIRGWADVCLPESPRNKLHLNHEITSMEYFAEKFEREVMDLLPADHELIIQFEPLNPRVNAEINKIGNSITILVMGGMLAHQKMNDNAFALLLCHELGHFLGGPPLKSSNGWSSTEGQADYFSGQVCVRHIELGESDFIDGAIRLTSIYSEVMSEPEPRISQCDQNKAPRTNFGYPSVQCRLDSILAGWESKPRPECWYNP